MPDLEHLRKKIDSVDGELVKLLEERFRLAGQIGGIKKKGKLPVLEPSREKQVLEAIAAKAAGAKGARKEFYKTLFREIISYSRALQEKPRVAYLGPEGSYSHQAVLKFFGNYARAEPCDSVEEVFDSMEQFGVVAVENSSEGSVNETLDCLVAKDSVIVGEIYLKVEHCLLAKPGVEMEDVKIVYAHPQALAQCKRFLRGLGFEAVQASSNAKACTMLDSRSAAIAGEYAANRYGLNVLKRGVNDVKDNATRFLVIGKAPAAPTGRDKTSIVFSLPHRAGSLHKALGIIAGKKLNMTKIESRPSRLMKWEYLFYVDLEGHAQVKPVKEALAGLKGYATSLRVLGSYPAA